MHVHRQRVQLAEGLEVAQEKDNDAAALNGLHGASQKVGGQRLKVLQHRHAVRVTQDVLSVLVVRVLDVRARHEEREGVLILGVHQPARHHLLDLLHSLFLVRGEVELLLVAPQHVGAGLHHRLAEHVVQVHNLLSRAIAHDHEQRPLVELDAILHQRPNA